MQASEAFLKFEEYASELKQRLVSVAGTAKAESLVVSMSSEEFTKFWQQPPNPKQLMAKLEAGCSNEINRISALLEPLKANESQSSAAA